MEQTRKLPIGIQDFEDLRTNGYLYVDKTAFIYNLTQYGKPYFLSRPRRFGKSLLLSTIEAYFLGKKDLFEGLAISELAKGSPDAFAPHPVLKFSLAAGEFTKPEGLRSRLDSSLAEFEEKYGLCADDSPLPVRFERALKSASAKAGRKVVVLVDEYDNPLLKNIGGNEAQGEANRDLYKGFFAVLKDCDAYLRFVFFTGVTKFSKVSIFSDLNQLNDISLDKKYDAICGISQKELESGFAPEIRAMAGEWKMTEAECLAELGRLYDGYHFSGDAQAVYNPFSLLNAFDKLRFGSYWFESGTPTFLIKKLGESKFDVRNFDGPIKISEPELKNYRPEDANPIPLLYQSGYLTIKGWTPRQDSYRLAFPNDEVKYGFLISLAPSYLHVEDRPAPFNIDLLDDAVEEGDRKWFAALFSLLPYPEGAGGLDGLTERNFQNVIYISLLVLGKYVRTEVHSSHGRADCTIETPSYVYVLEFKRDGSAKDALAQIERQGYAGPYAADRRRLFKIGINFSTERRNITEWEVGAE